MTPSPKTRTARTPRTPRKSKAPRTGPTLQARVKKWHRRILQNDKATKQMLDKNPEATWDIEDITVAFFNGSEWLYRVKWVNYSNYWNSWIGVRDLPPGRKILRLFWSKVPERDRPLATHPTPEAWVEPTESLRADLARYRSRAAEMLKEEQGGGADEDDQQTEEQGSKDHNEQQVNMEEANEQQTSGSASVQETNGKAVASEGIETYDLSDVKHATRTEGDETDTDCEDLAIMEPALVRRTCPVQRAGMSGPDRNENPLQVTIVIPPVARASSPTSTSGYTPSRSPSPSSSSSSSLSFSPEGSFSPLPSPPRYSTPPSSISQQSQGQGGYSPSVFSVNPDNTNFAYQSQPQPRPTAQVFTFASQGYAVGPTIPPSDNQPRRKARFQETNFVYDPYPVRTRGHEALERARALRNALYKNSTDAEEDTFPAPMGQVGNGPIIDISGNNTSRAMDQDATMEYINDTIMEDPQPKPGPESEYQSDTEVAELLFEQFVNSAPPSP